MNSPESPKSSSPFLSRALEQHFSMNLADAGALEHQRGILQRAAAIGLNRIHLGERWPDLGVRLVDYRETFPELATADGTSDAVGRKRVFKQISEEALELGIEPWASLNVFNYPDALTRLFPEAVAVDPPTADRWLRLPGTRGLSKQPQVCSSSAPFRKLMTAQLTELCQLPHVGGIECWLTAADCDLFYCACETCRPKSIADRIVEFAGVAHGVCVAHGKKLMLRTYLGGWRCALETEVWRDAAPRLAAGVEIGYKQQHGDMMNWHGPNPLAGELAPHQEHVEFDLGGEYRGSNYGMVCSIRWQLQELVRHFRERGVSGIICRGLDFPHAFDLDRWLFGALAQNPDLDVEAWCRDWAAQRYGAGSEEVLALLDGCAEVIYQSMYVRGVQWASWAVPQNLARLRFILFDRCAPCVPGSYERLQPTEKNIGLIIEEKRLALEKADALVEKCAGLKGKLADNFFDPLQTSISYLRAYTSITGPLLETFFRFLAWSQTSSEVTREYIRIPLLASLAEGQTRIAEAEQIIEKLDGQLLIGLTNRAGFVDPSSLNKFREPFQNASAILEEIGQQVETVSASWWAYYPTAESWPKALRHRHELYRDT